MNETKIYEKLLEHDDELKLIKQEVGEIKVSMQTLQNSTDKILHIVERLDQERVVTSHRLDVVEAQVTRLAGV